MPDSKQGEMFRKVCVFNVSRAVRIARFESLGASPNRSRIARYNATKVLTTFSVKLRPPF